MSNKLFIGGLSWGTTTEQLRENFEKYGEIQDAKVITDRESGRSRGFGFVTFAENESATTALGEMNGAEFDGRTIRVDVAHDRGFSRDKGSDDSYERSGRDW